MFNSSSTFSAASIPLSFNVTYSSPITSAKSAGIGVVGLYTGNTTDFSVNISVASFTTTTVRLTM